MTDPEAYGPKYKVLCSSQPQMARFCDFYHDLNDGPRSADLAGYSNSRLRQASWRLLHNEEVRAVLYEMAQYTMSSLTLPALRGAREIINDPSHPDRAKMILAIVDRNGFGPVQKTQSHIHHHIEETPEQVFRDLVRMVLEKDGDVTKWLGGNLTANELRIVDRVRGEMSGQKVIDITPVEVPIDPNDSGNEWGI